MSPIRDWIESILRIAREQAEFGEFDRHLQRSLFLFAIEIGKGRRLTSQERESYAKTMITAEAFLAMTEKHADDAHRLCHERILSDCVSDWQRHEPRLRRFLEEMLGKRFRAFDVPIGMWPELQDILEAQIRTLARAYPEEVPARELPKIIARLNYPLDRA